MPVVRCADTVFHSEFRCLGPKSFLASPRYPGVCQTAVGSRQTLRLPDCPLHGDSLSIELADPARNGDVPGAIERVAGVSEIAIEGRVLRARAQDGTTAMPAVLAALQGAGHAVTKVSMSRPSLDDVYLRHAGRAFHEADTETEKELAA